MNSLSPDLLRSLLAETNRCPQQFVSISKPIMRAMIFELIRFIEQEKLSDNERNCFIQRLTVEGTALHISDMIDELIIEPPQGLNTNMVLSYLKGEVDGIAKGASVQPEGRS